MIARIFLLIQMICLSAYTSHHVELAKAYEVIKIKSDSFIEQTWFKKMYSCCEMSVGSPFLTLSLSCLYADSMADSNFVLDKVKLALTDSVQYWSVPLISNQKIGYSLFENALDFKYHSKIDSLVEIGTVRNSFPLMELSSVWPSPQFFIVLVNLQFCHFFVVIGKKPNNLTPILLTNAYADDPFIQRDLHQKYLLKKEPDINQTGKRLELTYDFFENITIKDLPDLAKKSAFRSPYPYSKTVKWIKRKLCSEEE